MGRLLDLPGLRGALAWLEPVMLDAALRGAIVLAIAALLAHLLRRHSASTRHALWTAALLAQLAIPGLALLLPDWRVAVPGAPGWLAAKARDAEQTPAPHGARGPSTPAAGERRAPLPLGGPPQQHDASSAAEARNPAGPSRIETSRVEPIAPAPTPRPSPLALLWLAGALVVVARLAAGTLTVARLARRGEHVMDGGWLSLVQRLAGTLHIRRPLTLLRGGALAVPVTWGVVYPILLLPGDADEWSEERRRYVLVHEMAHVKRFDALTQLVAQLALALFWFDPLVWLAGRRMRAEREHACDDYVLRHGTAPSMYASDLLEMVRALGAPAHRGAQPAFAALAMARRSEFEGRMLSILDPHQERHPLRRGATVVLVSLAMLLVLPLAAVTPVRAASVASPAVTLSSVPGATVGPRPPAPGTTPGMRETAAATRPSAPREEALAPTPPAPITAPAARSALPTQYTCDTRHVDGTELSIHDDVNDQGRRTSMIAVHGGRCTQVTLTGGITLSADEREIARMTPGSYAYFRERTAALDRAVTCTPDERGAPRCRASRDGGAAPFDEEAREWLARMLPAMARELGIDVDARVARLRRQGGVGAVLDEVRRIRSASAKRVHLEALLDQGGLTDEELARVVETAAGEITSSGDVSRLLRRMPPRVAQSAAGRRALVAAIDGVPSSGDRAAVVTRYALQADRELLLALADVAARIPSSGDRTSFLRAAAGRYLARHDARLRAAFFEVVGTVPSSGDRSAVLLHALEFGPGDPEVTRGVIRGVRALPSSGDQAAVLLAVTKRKLLRPELREDFFKSASTIGASGDYRAVMESALP